MNSQQTNVAAAVDLELQHVNKRKTNSWHELYSVNADRIWVFGDRGRRGQSFGTERVLGSEKN